jgi:hypothetical protein
MQIFTNSQLARSHCIFDYTNSVIMDEYQRVCRAGPRAAVATVEGKYFIAIITQ